jgi:hypothetical protein
METLVVIIPGEEPLKFSGERVEAKLLNEYTLQIFKNGSPVAIFTTWKGAYKV